MNTLQKDEVWLIGQSISDSKLSLNNDVLRLLLNFHTKEKCKIYKFHYILKSKRLFLGQFI